MNKKNNKKYKLPGKELMERVDKEINGSGDKNRKLERDRLLVEGSILLSNVSELMRMYVSIYKNIGLLVDRIDSIGGVDEVRRNMDKHKVLYESGRLLLRQFEEARGKGIGYDKEYDNLMDRINTFYGGDVMGEYRNGGNIFSDSIDNTDSDIEVLRRLLEESAGGEDG